MTSQALRQRTTARRVLAILIGLLATLLGLQVLASVTPGGYTALAQDPSPTETTGGRTIEIINPDATTSTELSNKHDGTDSAYHLVAWVNNPQSTDAVEFQYIPDDSTVALNIQCIETGTARARFVSPDTYECHWNLANVPEGDESGELRAILYLNNNPGPTDSEAVTIDRSAQTVEITYPTNGGAIGFYTAPDGTTSGTIDFRTSGSTGAEDEGTQDVIAYYSVAPPGSEPDFIQCSDGAHETEPGSNDSVRCTLTADDPDTAANEGHSPEQVTAVALVARDVSEGEFTAELCPESPNPGNPLCDEPDPDSADGHRALGYGQDPTTVTIIQQTQQATPQTCTQVITATVRDQFERKIVGANVDVHGQGPTDNLFFDDTDSADDSTSEHQAPENGHTTEGTVDCESEETPRPFNNDSLQGKHEELAPTADIKHIESVPGEGTDDDGAFRFRLYSPDTGTTQFTAWADEDGNDRFCSEEAHGNGSVGWSTTAPSPTGVAAEDTSCPKPEATPTPTPTESATPTPTPTPTETDDGNVVQRGPCKGHPENSNTARPGGGRVIVGTSGPDEITGSSGNDLICGLGGRDSIRGRDGDDEIYGGRGNDDIRGNQGDDTIAGNRGLDIIRGGDGHDIIRGGAHDDTIRGFTGRDRLVGGGGSDTLRAGRGRDRLKGNKGDDILDGGPGRDRCTGGGGRDRLIRCE